METGLGRKREPLCQQIEAKEGEIALKLAEVAEAAKREGARAQGGFRESGNGASALHRDLMRLQEEQKELIQRYLLVENVLVQEESREAKEKLKRHGAALAKLLVGFNAVFAALNFALTYDLYGKHSQMLLERLNNHAIPLTMMEIKLTTISFFGLYAFLSLVSEEFGGSSNYSLAFKRNKRLERWKSSQEDKARVVGKKENIKALPQQLLSQSKERAAVAAALGLIRTVESAPCVRATQPSPEALPDAKPSPRNQPPNRPLFR